MKDDLRVKAWCIVSSDNCCVSLSLVSESDAWDRVCFTNGDRLSEGVLRQCGWKCVRVWLSRREEEESEIHPALEAGNPETWRD